jgi:16S rRNA (guanine527-N7)-methyltransferase
LLEWNKKINLISRKSEEAVWEEQILHSLSFLGWVDLKDFVSVIDIGTGGGLPGIPLKIVRPGLRVTLLDSIKKKVDAVREMISALGLRGIEAECGRAEEVGGSRGGHPKYEYAICRGVGELADIWSYGYPLLIKARSAGTGAAVGQSQKMYVQPGSVIALKGGDMGGEIRKMEQRVRGISITAIDILLKTDELLKNPDKKIILLQKIEG